MTLDELVVVNGLVGQAARWNGKDRAQFNKAVRELLLHGVEYPEWMGQRGLVTVDSMADPA